MNNVTAIVGIISTAVVVLAFIFFKLYPYVQMVNKPLADKLIGLEKLAEYIVTQEATHEDKSGQDKKSDATQALLEQAEKSYVKLTESTAKGLIQTAYDKTQTDGTSNMPATDGYVTDDDNNDNDNSKD